jgi:hypothetical protein
MSDKLCFKHSSLFDLPEDEGSPSRRDTSDVQSPSTSLISNRSIALDKRGCPTFWTGNKQLRPLCKVLNFELSRTAHRMIPLRMW